MILVVGATGTNGREVLNRLVAAGRPARALVRDPEKAAGTLGPGVEVVRGDLDDPASLGPAFEGVERAFFLAAVDPRYVRWFGHFLDAALKSKTPHVVKFSALGAHPASPVEIFRQHGETDAALAASGLGYTILRPNAFYQNLLWSAQTIKEQGTIYQPMGIAKQSLVDVRDIADVAVAALTQDGHAGKTYEVTGPESLSFAEIAATFSRVLAKPVKHVDVSPEAALAGMLASGMPEWNAKAVTDLVVSFANGSASRTSDTVEKVAGHPPITFEQFARDHVDLFL
jgi:uncharacterized protein YbjT (DUF2867 family)